jgi:bifunctional DNA-binding transcriptional regulator/antitoxin component of YhaV-PrlF toxin-antitoxin module
MKLQENNGKYFLYIPASVIKMLGWKKGDDIDHGPGTAKGRIELRKK